MTIQTPQLPAIIERATNPCANRILCGPIRILPRDRAERTAFIVRIALQAVDGIVTSAGLRASHRTYHDPAARYVYSYAGCHVVGGSAPCALPFKSENYVYLSARVGPRPGASTYEADPVAKPFVSGSLLGTLIGGALGDIMMSRAMQSWSPRQRTIAYANESVSHAYGISTWFPLFAAVRHADA